VGATVDADGVNFSLFSGNATGLELYLFQGLMMWNPSGHPVRSFVNKTFHFWHVYVRGLRPGAFYAFRVDGPADAGAGLRFNQKQGSDRSICARQHQRAVETRGRLRSTGQSRDVHALRRYRHQRL